MRAILIAATALAVLTTSAQAEHVKVTTIGCTNYDDYMTADTLFARGLMTAEQVSDKFEACYSLPKDTQVLTVERFDIYAIVLVKLKAGGMVKLWTSQYMVSIGD